VNKKIKVIYLIPVFLMGMLLGISICGVELNQMVKIIKEK